MTKLSGGLNNYYVVPIKNPQRKEQEPYQAECEDIIQALGMTFDEGCAFKALWRNAAARMGNGKPGNEALYDCQKLVHYANRILKKEEVAKHVAPLIAAIPIPIIRYNQHPYVYKRMEHEEGWIYSSRRPSITKPYLGVEVVYRSNNAHHHYFYPSQVKWDDVLKYRINYS